MPILEHTCPNCRWVWESRPCCDLPAHSTFAWCPRCWQVIPLLDPMPRPPHVHVVAPRTSCRHQWQPTASNRIAQCRLCGVYVEADAVRPRADAVRPRQASRPPGRRKDTNVRQPYRGDLDVDARDRTSGER